MDTPKQSTEQVNISSSDSSSDGDCKPQTKRLCTNAEIVEPNIEVTSEDALLRKAQMYQEYMKQIPIPSKRGSVIPFTSWTGLGTSIKKLYGQPLHYLTNIHLRQLDCLRIGAQDEHRLLDTLVSPPKAEASIWLLEEFHRLSSSPHHLVNLWLSDRFYHVYIDPIFLEQPGSSNGVLLL